MARNTLLESTIEAVKFYSNAEKTILVKRLIERGIITNNEDESNKKPLLKDIDINAIIQTLLQTNENIIKDIEQWEYDKAYKYSIFYDVENMDEKEIKKLLDTGKIFSYDNRKDEYEIQHLRINEVSTPSLKIIDGKYIFKYNVRLRRYEANNKEISVRYPICVIIDLEKKYAEVRFDAYPGLYDGDKLQHVQGVTSWFFENLRVNLREINLYPTMKAIIMDVNSVMEKYKNKIEVIWQDMKLAKGGKATVGCDKGGKLPFIGELRDFMVENESEFAKAPVLKDKFERFIDQHIKLSEYPSVKIIYNELKDLETKMFFKYEKHDFTLVQHYADTTQESVKKERMEYVSDFIFDNRKNYLEKTFEQKTEPDVS